MYCEEGHPAAETDRFCPKCGKRIDPDFSLLKQGIGAKYEIKRVLGRGGMGAVYEALDRALSRTVAIKLLASEHLRDPDLVERFRREARHTAAFPGHPNVITVHEAGEISDRPYYVMEFARENLREYLDRHPVIDPEEVLRLGIGMLKGLSALHDRGIIHREIKPENILLNDEGEPRITDFGIARSTNERITETGAVFGSPAYMSPEQLEDASRVDHRSDLYSAALILSEMVSGFSGALDRNTHAMSAGREGVTTVLMTPRSETPARQLAPSQNLIRVLKKALAKSPGSRFQSADEFLRALQELRAGRGAGVSFPWKGLAWACGFLLVLGGLVATTYALYRSFAIGQSTSQTASVEIGTTPITGAQVLLRREGENEADYVGLSDITLQLASGDYELILRPPPGYGLLNRRVRFSVRRPDDSSTASSDLVAPVHLPCPIESRWDGTRCTDGAGGVARPQPMTCSSARPCPAGMFCVQNRCR